MIDPPIPFISPTAATPVRTISYGPDESHRGDLHLPASAPKAIVALLHGGFWRMPYGREETGAIARDLAARGYAVWNLEYRRLGAPGGGWPGTFDDVADGLDHLAVLAGDVAGLDPQRVIVAGHSAGGHLALWSAARGGAAPGLRRPSRVRPIAAAGLAAITDVADMFASGAGGGAAAELLGGSPDARPERYATASPLMVLPLGVPQLIVHGTGDTAVPIATARRYASAAGAAGDDVEFVELPHADHMDPTDPASEAHAALVRWLERIAG